MFGNAYQNGHYFEVWDSKTNNDKNETYKQLVKIVPPSNKKYFDKDIKSYIYSFEGQNAKMVLPASDQKQLALHQKYLVLQIFIPIGSSWSMEIGMTDINGIKRRINMTTVQGKNEAKYFSLRYPLESLQRGVWMFLSINVHSFMDAFKGQVFRSLDHLTIGSNCLMRRIFMMKQWIQWEIPKGFWFGNQVQQEMQLIQYHQLSLPKINLHKSAHNQQSPPIRSQKQSSVKKSKTNLTRSEITPKLLTKSKIISQSPQRPQKPYAQANKKKSFIHQKSSNIVNEFKMKQILKKEQIIKKQGNTKKNQIEKSSQNRVHTERIEQKVLKNSSKKSPILQKSFQQDEAFDYHPEQDQQVNQQTSHESLIYQQPKLQKNWEKWEQQESPNKKINASENPIKKQTNNILKPGRTILTKENSVKKIGKEETKNQLQLIYDEMVGCYYHPQTHTYYEIKQ